VAFELQGEFDLVTEADRASEKLVVRTLRRIPLARHRREKAAGARALPNIAGT